VFLHHGTDPVSPIGADVADLGAAALARGFHRVEERLEGGLVPARRSPHQPAGVVVDHDRQVLVATFVGNLVDPDPPQLGEPIMQLLDVGPYPGDDRAHGAPSDSHQLSDCGLRALRGQPGHLIVERQGVARAVPGPRHRLHRDPMTRTVHPRRVGLKPHRDRAQIQCPPTTPTLATVVAPAPTPASAAASGHLLLRPNMNDQDLIVLVILDVLHNRLVDPHQGTP